MGVTIAYIFFQTMIMMLFGREFMPDNSWILKRIFGDPPLTPKQIEAKKESERIARRVEFDKALEWHRDCIAKHSQRKR